MRAGAPFCRRASPVFSISRTRYSWGTYEFDGVEGELYPTVGVDTERLVFVNFGERPSVFNLREFGRKDNIGVDGEDEGFAFWTCVES